jgi:hypothetical protein
MFNAYSMVQDLRGMVAESVAKHWSNEAILSALNKSLTNIYRKIALTSGDWFVKQSSSITPVAGVITLPSDCSKPLYVEEVTSGTEIPLGIVSARDRGMNMRYSDRLSYNGLLAWPEEGVLRVNDDSYTTAVYVWYERRIPLMHAGTATGGTTPSLILADDRNVSYVDDYYNGTIVEILSSSESFTLRALISDYNGGSIAASLTLLTGGWVANLNGYLYGTVPVIPPEALDYLIHKALLYLLFKPGSSVQKEQIYFIRDEVADAEKSFQQWASSRLKVNSRVRYTGAYANG